MHRRKCIEEVHEKGKEKEQLGYADVLVQG